MYILFVVYTAYVYSHLIYIRLICLSADELWSFVVRDFHHRLHLMEVCEAL